MLRRGTTAGRLTIAIASVGLAALAAQASGCGLPTSGLGDQTVVTCSNDAQCDDGQPCSLDVCTADKVCSNDPLDGDPPTQKAGDCQTLTCNAGTPVVTADPGDADDGEFCTMDSCSGSLAVHTPIEGSCPFGASMGTCKEGKCTKECTGAGDVAGCDDGRPCTVDSCDEAAGACVNDPAPLQGMPTPGVTDMPSDCIGFVCVDGQSLRSADNSEIPDDLNDCTADSCAGGAAVNQPLAEGSTCGVGGTGHCNVNAQCVGCTDATQCVGNDQPCKWRTCEGGVCGVAVAGAGTQAGQQAIGDCRDHVCDGAGNEIDVANDADFVANPADECVIEGCSMMQPVTSAAPAGTPAPNQCPASPPCGNTGACNLSGGCALAGQGTQCVGPMCVGGQLKAAQTCDGAGQCNQGGALSSCGPQICSGNACVNCVTDIDCGGSNYCNAGSCAPKKADGQTCSNDNNAQCLNANCNDGYCCPLACTGSCKSCQGTKTGQPNGTCANVTVGYDPENLCGVGSNCCKGNGDCGTMSCVE